MTDFRYNATEFDEKFDAGEDVSGAIDWSRMRRPNERPRRVNVDFPAWIVDGLDEQARHLGVTRTSPTGALKAVRYERTRYESASLPLAWHRQIGQYPHHRKTIETWGECTA